MVDRLNLQPASVTSPRDQQILRGLVFGNSLLLVSSS